MCPQHSIDSADITKPSSSMRFVFSRYSRSLSFLSRLCSRRCISFCYHCLHFLQTPFLNTKLHTIRTNAVLTPPKQLRSLQGSSRTDLPSDPQRKVTTSSLVSVSLRSLISRYLLITRAFTPALLPTAWLSAFWKVGTPLLFGGQEGPTRGVS